MPISPACSRSSDEAVPARPPRHRDIELGEVSEVRRRDRQRDRRVGRGRPAAGQVHAAVKAVGGGVETAGKAQDRALERQRVEASRRRSLTPAT